MASAPIIGMASAQSGITLDDSKVSGTATLFEGSKITADGYTIIANLGDQESDLAGGYAEKTFKLPNPFYLTE